MLNSLSQLTRAKVAFATVLLGLISSSQAVYPDSSGQVHLELTVKTAQGNEWGSSKQDEWSNVGGGQGVRVTLGTFPLDKRLLAGEVVIPPGVLVTEIAERYDPAVNTQCVVLSAEQGLADLQEARSLPLVVNQARELAQGLRIFCAEFAEDGEDPYMMGSRAGLDE